MGWTEEFGAFPEVKPFSVLCGWQRRDITKALAAFSKIDTALDLCSMLTLRIYT